MNLRVLGVVLMVLPAGCASMDPSYRSALQARDALGDRCNGYRDAWRADITSSAPPQTIEADRQRTNACAADFRVAQAHLEQVVAARSAALQEVGAALQAAGDNVDSAATRYGQAARDIQPPPTPPQLPQGPDLSASYQYQAPPHGCAGNVPVSGPGLNPCPSP